MTWSLELFFLDICHKHPKMHRSVRLESKKIVQLDTQQCGLSWFIIIFPKIAIDLGCFRDRTDWTTLDSPVFFFARQTWTSRTWSPSWTPRATSWHLKPRRRRTRPSNTCAAANPRWILGTEKVASGWKWPFRSLVYHGLPYEIMVIFQFAKCKTFSTLDLAIQNGDFLELCQFTRGYLLGTDGDLMLFEWEIIGTSTKIGDVMGYEI